MRHQCRFLAILALAYLFPYSGQSVHAQEGLRQWVNSSGQSIKATLVDMDAKDQTVLLLREDGREFKIPIRSLSESDKEYIQERVARYTWKEVAALDPASPELRLALNAMRIGDELEVIMIEKEKPSPFKIRRVDPIGYRERYLCAYDGKAPEQMAVDNQGNLVFLSWETKPTSIQRISVSGVLATVYQTPETADCNINTPTIEDSSQIAATSNGEFFLGSRWKEVIRSNGNEGFTSRFNYFTMRLGAAKPVFTPHFSETAFPVRSRIQTLEAFAGDQLIILHGQIGLHEMPKSSTKVPEGTSSPRYAASWNLKTRPLQVISKSQMLVMGYGGDYRMVFLVDLEAKTFAPIGPIAKTSEEMKALPAHLAVSPNGQHLVWYDEREKAFKRLVIGK